MNGLGHKRIARIMAYALVPLTLLSLTFIVLAKEPDLLSMVDENENQSAGQRDGLPLIAQVDLSPEFLYETTGTASYYGATFHNRKTASGEKYDMYEMSAAHLKLPFGTIVRVTNLKNFKTVLLRINDRGPFIRKRILDLSYQAAKELKDLGLPKIKLETLIPPDQLVEVNGIKYYFGYSYDNPLICIPQTAMKVLDSTNQFQNAISLYEYYKAKTPFEIPYIFVIACNDFKCESEDSEVRYFIATINMKEENQLINRLIALK